ncbi:MAG: peptidoglycan-associated lipoprotein Pal [Burkholderiales bacterium]
MWKLIASVLFVALLAGCASKDVKPEQSGAAVEDRAATKPAQPSEQPSQARAATSSEIAGNPLKDPSNILSKRSVYYEYDSAAIDEQYKPMVQAHSKYLQGNNNTRISVEGHCDERGSREYNLALGQRRADGVKKAMTLLGVSGNQITTVSYGKEKPKASGSNEAAWAQNRRSDLVYPGD